MGCFTAPRRRHRIKLKKVLKKMKIMLKNLDKCLIFSNLEVAKNQLL